VSMQNANGRLILRRPALVVLRQLPPRVCSNPLKGQRSIDPEICAECVNNGSWSTEPLVFESVGSRSG